MQFKKVKLNACAAPQERSIVLWVTLMLIEVNMVMSSFSTPDKEHSNLEHIVVRSYDGPLRILTTNFRDDRLFDTVPQTHPIGVSSELYTSSIANSSISGPVTLETNNDALCRVNLRRRRSLLPGIYGKSLEVVETAITCSRIVEPNYKDVIKNIYTMNRSVINQIHINDTESQVLFSVIDLICGHFDCSKLTVFNVTGQNILDYNTLTHWFSLWPQLEVLDLSDAFLYSLQSILPVDPKLQAISLRNLTHLYLDSNKINELNFNFLLERMPNLRHLSLVDNKIFNIYCNESLRPKMRSQLESVYLAGNGINCDRSQLWLLKLFLNPLSHVKFPNQELIKCEKPEHMTEMTWIQRISVHETKICNECNCRSLKRTAISVDCHSKNLTALPDILPLNTKVLNLTSNRISSLSLTQNSKNWENVTYVHLDNNLISSFQQLEVNSKFMRNLAALDIRRNKFQEFPSHILEQFINLDQVHLSNNPWLCDCESTFAFQEWLQRQFHKVGDKDEIRCGVSGKEENGLRSIDLQQRLSSRVIYKLSKSELCPQDSSEEPNDWWYMINLILGITIFSVITKVIIDYIYQRRTKRLPHFLKINLC